MGQDRGARRHLRGVVQAMIIPVEFLDNPRWRYNDFRERRHYFAG